MVPGFRHLPGNHCGSTALRNLLAFHGLEISEEMALGLGAGVCFYYVALDGSSPSRFINGRTARLEEQFLELTGTPLELQTFDNTTDSWDAARATVDAGHPALLLTDIYYLDHYGNSAYFPGHAVVLAGYDEENAYVSDTAFEDLQTTRLTSLARARHGDYPVYPLEGHMVTLPNGVALPDVRAAAPAAVNKAAAEMLEPALGEYQGLPAMRRFAAEVGNWPAVLEDWQWCARFSYQVSERRGTGGGMFRLMYSRFLEEAGFDQAPLAAEAAARWTALAEALLAASESDEPEAEIWSRVGNGAAAVLDAEERLWAALAA